MVSYSRFKRAAFLVVTLLLLSGANSIAYSANDSDPGAGSDLYHNYICPSSYFSCQIDSSDRGYDLRHETNMDRLYRQYREERELEKMNSHGQ